jgi:hypothetical protein
MADGLTRRTFLRLVSTLAACAAPTLPSTTMASSTARSDAEAAVSRYLDVVSQWESAAAVGTEYLRRTPDENDPNVLLERLAASGFDAKAADGMSDEQLIEMVRARLQADFDRGRVVNVDGWVLSVTEARICALATGRG